MAGREKEMPLLRRCGWPQVPTGAMTLTPSADLLSALARSSDYGLFELTGTPPQSFGQ